MKAKKQIINLFIFFLVFDLIAQQKKDINSYLKKIQNVQIFNFIFILPEVNKISLDDTLFFMKYEKKIDKRIGYLKRNDVQLLSAIELLLIHKSLDTIIISKNNTWNKDIFKKIKTLTPLPQDTTFNEKTLNEYFNFKTDETNVEDLIFYTFLLYNSEKFLNICTENKNGLLKLKSWEEDYFPFSSCDYLPYLEVLDRQKQYFKVKYKNTLNPTLKSIIKNIQIQKPDC